MNFRRLFPAIAYGAVLLSCGRDPMAPIGDSVRFARALSLKPVFPPAFEQTAGAFAVAPFTRVRVVFTRASGVAALDTLVAFPPGADSLSLTFAIPLASDAPSSGEPLEAFLYCISAQGDTVFKGGPITVIAIPGASSSAAAPAVAVPLQYSGAGASAVRVRIDPKVTSVTSGDGFIFTATALDTNGQAIARTPIMFRSADVSLAALASSASGAGEAVGAHGSTFIIAQLITGQADTAIIIVTAPVTTPPGVATKLVFTAQPGNAIAGATIAPAITASAEDAFGAVVASFTGAVTISIGAGPTGSSLAGGTTVNAVGGVATFSNISLTNAASGYRIAANAGGLTPDTSAAFTIGAAGAAKISVSSGDKQTGTPAAPLGSLLAAIVSDAFGNAVSGFTVNWAVTSGKGSFASATSSTNIAGIATNSWTLGSDLGDQKATASSSGLNGSPVTFSATAAAGVATKLVFVTRPADVAAGEVITPAIMVRAQDGLENPQTSFTGSVTISIGRNPGGGSLAGTTTVAAVGGIATFSDLALGKAGSNYRLAAASGTLAPDTSSNFNVTAASAANLAISGGNAQTGAVATELATQLSVTVTDAFGNPASFSTVVFAIASGGGTLSNALVPTNSAGIATTKWRLGPVTGAQSVTAAAAGLVGSPATFTATAIAGAAKQLTIISQPSSAVAGNALTPAIVVRASDASGNPAPSFTGNVSLSFDANPAGGKLGGTTSVNAVAGVATFSTVTLDKAGAGYRLRANAGGLTGDTTVTFSVSNAVATNVAANGGNGQTGLAASALPTPLSVLVIDANGNPVPGATVAWAVTSGGGSVSPTTTATNALGIGSTTWTLGPAAGAGTVTATSAGLAGSPVSFTATGIASAAAKLVIVSQPSSAVAGSALSPAIIVQARDATNNLVTTFTGSVSLSFDLNPAGATLGGTVAVNASDGIATFSTVTLNKAGTGYRLRVNAGGLTGDTTATFSVSNAVATNVATNGGNGQTGLAANALPTPLSVIVTDAGGNPVPAVPVVWSVTSGGGTISPATSTTNALGIANATWTLGAVAGAGTAIATSAGLTGSPVSFTATGNASAATRLVIISQPASAVAGSALTPAIVVQARDVSNNLVTTFGGSIALSMGTNPGGATLGGTTSAGAVGGVATFGNVTLNKAGTGYSLRANAGGLTGDTTATFSVSNAVAANIAANGGGGQTGLAASALPTPLSVIVNDANGNPVPGVSVAWAVTSGGGSVSPATIATNALGLASATWTLGAVAGAGTATATSAGLTGSPVSFTATGIASAAAKLVIVSQPTIGVAGSALSPAIVVQARDASNNLVTSFSGSVALSMATNPGGATLGGITSAGAVGGVATFGTVTLNKAGTGYSLRANAGGLTGDTTATFSVSNAVATNVAASGGNGQTGLAANALPTPLVVTVTDANGNPVPGVSVSWEVTSGGGSVSPATAATNALGIANTTWTLGPVAGAGTATATSAGLAGSPVSFTATGIAGAATRLVIVAQPSSVAAGTPIAPPILVQVRDATNNLVTSFGGSVALSMGTNPGGATLGGTTSVSAVGGVATFAGVTLNRSGTGFTLVASAGGLASDISATFSVSNAVAANIAANGGGGQTGLSASALPTPLSVIVNDANGNPVPGVSIAWAVTSGGGSVSPATIATNALGNASATWTLGPVAGAGTATATSAGLTGSPVSFTATGVAGAATKLVIVAQPSSIAAGAPIAPPIVVQARDATNNLVASFSGSVALSIGTNPGSATIGGTTSALASGGVATFAGVTLNRSGTGFTLVASAGGLASDVSAVFNVTTGPASILTIAGGNNQTNLAASALPNPLSVTVTDASGNPVGGVAVTWAVSSGAGSLAAASSLTNGAGVATDTWTLGPLAGVQSVSATAAGLTGSPAIFSATATSGTATHVVFSSRPGNAIAGANLSPSIVISALDSAENVATTFSGPVSVTFAANPGGATLNGTTTVNAVAGVASFGGISITKAATGYRLLASSGTLTNDTLPPFTISAAAAAVLSITAGDNQAAAISHALVLPLGVTVTDAFGNPVAGFPVSWAVVTTGGGSVGGTTTLTNGSGVATTSWTLGSIVGRHSVTATATGLVGSPATFSATATAGAATQLVITSQPGGGIAGAAFGFVVTAEDASGNVATSFTGNVSLALGTRPGGTSLAGTTSVTSVAGVATFTNLSVTTAFAGYTIVANSGGVTSSTSSAFNIDAAAPATISISGGGSQSGAIATLLNKPLSVTVVDAYSNPVPNVTVTWAVVTGGGSLGSSIAQTNAVGIATNTWTLGLLVGQQSVSATAAGLTPVTFVATGR